MKSNRKRPFFWPKQSCDFVTAVSARTAPTIQDKPSESTLLVVSLSLSLLDWNKKFISCYWRYWDWNRLGCKCKCRGGGSTHLAPTLMDPALESIKQLPDNDFWGSNVPGLSNERWVLHLHLDGLLFQRWTLHLIDSCRRLFVGRCRIVYVATNRN